MEKFDFGGARIQGRFALLQGFVFASQMFGDLLSLSEGGMLAVRWVVAPGGDEQFHRLVALSSQGARRLLLSRWRRGVSRVDASLGPLGFLLIALPGHIRSSHFVPSREARGKPSRTPKVRLILLIG